MQDTYISDEGNGFPLVLVHGFLGSSKMWEPQIEFFKDYFRVITPDLPGFGRSNKAKSHNSIQSIANLLLDCLEEKKIDISIGTNVKESLLEAEEEKDLYKHQIKFSTEVRELLNNEEYEKAMECFSRIAIYLEKFFENVKVNIENKEIKENRLMLLSMIRNTFINFADFSLIDAENEAK